jgi:RNA recognition motif-containing protein
MNLYVSNLGFNVEESALNTLFKEYGSVGSVKIIMDKITNRSRGFAFIEMADVQQAEKAIKELNGIMVEGRQMKVIEARPKPSSSW